MDITITGKNIEVTPSLREYVHKKIGRLEKYFNQLIDAHAVLLVEKIIHIAEVTINGDNVVFHAEVRTEDMYASVDNIFEKLEKQIRRYKEKHSGHRIKPLKDFDFERTIQPDEEFSLEMFEVTNKPMLPAEAISQLKLNQYRFLLFRHGLISVETPGDFRKHSYSVAYCRKDGNYALVELDNGVPKITTFVDKGDGKSDPEILHSRDFQLNRLTPEDAAHTLRHLKADYYIYQNMDDNHLNIVYNLADGRLAVKMPPA